MADSVCVPPEQLLRQLRWRYATKKFDPAKKISAEQWTALEEALVLSPSSYGLQPWKFLVVTHPETRAKLVPASWKQTQPVECSHFVVFAVKKDLNNDDIQRLIDRTAEVRGVPSETLDGFKKMMIRIIEGMVKGGLNVNEWSAHQVYIALGQFMTSAALLGIDTCPMEGIEPAKYDEILGLRGTAYTTVVACAAGYRADGDKYATSPKVRYKKDDLIQHV